MKFYQKLVRIVDDAHLKANRQTLIPHCERTVYWFEQLYPNMTQAMKMAAYAHDIERSIPIRTGEKPFVGGGPSRSVINEDRLIYHQTRSAIITKDILLKMNVPAVLLEDVYYLVLKHEQGGNFEQNLLKDADSLSFLENNINWFLTRIVPKIGKTAVKEKFVWMYERITNKDAKILAEPMVQTALSKLTRQ